jgi:transcriptional regulator with XRE-family HTH domain
MFVIDSTVAQAFGRILRERRRKLGMTQTQVAELTGKKQSQIVRLERGLADPRLSSLVQVANSVGMEIMAVPTRLVPAVRHLLREQEGGPATRSRLVGNDPEDAEDAEDDDES